MTDVSVIVCTHNPRPDHLRRSMEALNLQSFPKDNWELLVIDNASQHKIDERLDLSWHPRAKHFRENDLGLTPARLRGIEEAAGDLLVFVDDDNVLASDFLKSAVDLHRRNPDLGVFGSGSLEPEFEMDPEPDILRRKNLLAVRSVAQPRCSDNILDFGAIPWGAGLCVVRSVAEAYGAFVQNLDKSIPLDRKGTDLFSGGDDLFSWVAVSSGFRFGIFPHLRVIHMIRADRVAREYFLRLVRDHAYSNHVRNYLISGIEPQKLDWVRSFRARLHGLKNGSFSMECMLAEWGGEDRAARFIASKGLRPFGIAKTKVARNASQTAKR
jgi:glycosyltransferase involved in cell wall biosynthesis